MSDAQANEAEKNIEIWKVKKLIKRLEAARGNGTSMISLIIREFCNPFATLLQGVVLTRVCSPKGSSFTGCEDVG
jgi:peptide subunit release factor 1 (eRF1)